MNSFQHAEQDIERFRRRILLSGAFVFLCFCLLFARFFYLQVMRHEYYATRAESNRISFAPVMPNRGSIVDRNGVVLARNYAAFTLEIVPSKTNGLEETIKGMLGAILEPRSHAVYVCGHSGTVHNVVANLARRGFRLDIDLYREKYYP